MARVALDAFLYQPNDTDVRADLLAVLLAVGILVVGARLQPRRSAGLLAIPERLFKAQAIDADEFATSLAAARVMASWRRRGALIGALTMAVPVFIARNSLPLSLVAVLAGSTGGLAAAQWWRTSGPVGAVRIARLERRTVIGLVGIAPVLLLAVTLTTAVGATVAWLIERTHTGATVLTSGHAHCYFNRYTPSLSGPAIGWTSAVLALLASGAAAAATARRGADAVLAPAADLALRKAGTRAALGSAVTVSASLAAGMLFMLRSIADDRLPVPSECGSTAAWDTTHGHVLLLAALICIVIAMTALLSDVLFPGRISDGANQPIRA